MTRAPITRRQALTAAPVALALTTPLNAAPRVDPVVAAFDVWQAKTEDALAAFRRADERAPLCAVKVPLASGGYATAFADDGIDMIIERQMEAANGFAVDFPAPTADEIKRRDHVLANPYTADADALKAQLAILKTERDAIFQAEHHEEKSFASWEVYDALIETPAESVAGIAAKVRAVLLGRGCEELEDGSFEPDHEDPDEIALCSILRDAERLAGESLA